MTTIISTYTHMVGDYCLGEWDFEADVDMGEHGVSVMSVHLLQNGGKLPLWDNGDEFCEALYWAIAEHCETSPEIRHMVLDNATSNADNEGDYKFHQERNG